MKTPDRPKALDSNWTLSITRHLGSEFYDQLLMQQPLDELVIRIRAYLQEHPQAVLIGAHLQLNKKTDALNSLFVSLKQQLGMPTSFPTAAILERVIGREYCICVLGTKRLNKFQYFKYLWFKYTLRKAGQAIFDDLKS